LDQVIDLLKGAHWNDGLCKLLSGQADVDRWDYVMRDAAAAGVVYGRYDLDWLILSLSLYPDFERRPRLLIEAHRGLVALEHFLAARRSMYQQIYYHPTVRGAERLLRAVFERACDPTRPKGYKKETTNDIPKCLHRVLKGTRDRPTLGEFIATDDTTIIAALKRWSHSATDPVLRYLAGSLFDRRLFKEVRFDAADVDSVRATAKAVVRKALRRQAASLPAVDAADRQALDYFVLVDTCEFKKYSRFDGILFDCGETSPRTFDELQKRTEYNIASGQRPFTRTKIFVPSDVLSSVKAALRKLEKK
jgi:HD superfamily phosphohydrolase